MLHLLMLWAGLSLADPTPHHETAAATSAAVASYEPGPHAYGHGPREKLAQRLRRRRSLDQRQRNPGCHPRRPRFADHRRPSLRKQNRTHHRRVPRRAGLRRRGYWRSTRSSMSRRCGSMPRRAYGRSPWPIGIRCWVSRWKSGVMAPSVSGHSRPELRGRFPWPATCRTRWSPRKASSTSKSRSPATAADRWWPKGTSSVFTGAIAAAKKIPAVASTPWAAAR